MKLHEKTMHKADWRSGDRIALIHWIKSFLEEYIAPIAQYVRMKKTFNDF